MLRENSKLNMIELPINRGFSYEKKGEPGEKKTLLTLCQNRESSLSSQEVHCSSRPIPTSSNQSGDSPLT